MPVFGADPDSEGSEWEEMPVQQRYVSKPVRDLTNYFAYHKNMRMDQRCTEADKSRLNILFSRKLKQGFDSLSIREMIDRFYQSPAGQHEFASALFCRDDVQQQLSEDIEVTSTNPVIQWFLDGMPDGDPNIPNAGRCRKAIVMNCEESLLRYPDVVASIVEYAAEDDDLSDFLYALESLILWNLGDSSEEVDTALSLLCKIPLPQELGSRVRAPKSIRRRQPTVKDAVVKIPVRRKRIDT